MLRVGYSIENGIILNQIAFVQLISKGTLSLEFLTYKNLFKNLKEDPSLFGLINISDSVNGCKKDLFNNFFEKKLKVFAEIYLEPQFFYYELGEEVISEDPIYIDKMTYDLLYKHIDKLYPNLNYIIENNISKISEKIKSLKIISTDPILSQINKKLHRKIKIDFDTRLKYLLVGRAFYDLPPDTSDKVFVIAKITKELMQENILSILKKSGLNILKVIKNIKYKSKKFDEFYFEITFAGLMDLSKLEEISDSIWILGITDSAKSYKF